MLFLLFIACLGAVAALVGRALWSALTGRRTLPANSDQLRVLTEEHRRMSDKSVAASEHVDLRLADLSARVDELRGQVQRILTDVE